MRNEDKEMAFNKKKNAEAEAPEVAQEETPVEEADEYLLYQS